MYERVEWESQEVVATVGPNAFSFSYKVIIEMTSFIKFLLQFIDL